MTAASDPIAAISESAATGEVRGLFEDIKAVLEVPVVNLIFRHLATLPGCLEWSWAALRPLYVSGRISEAADRLTGSLDLPAVARMTRAEMVGAGVDTDGERQVATILDAYNRSNVMNIVALMVLLAGVRSATAPAAVQLPDPVKGGRSGPTPRPLPPLLSLEVMSDETRALVVALNALGDREDGRVMASMYRHLAHWPGYLALALTRLAPLAESGALAAATDRVREGARREAAALGPRPGGPGAPAGAERRALESALDSFTSNTIAKMLPIARILRAALPLPVA